jgi:phosphoglycolate phosphatase-like HAD superfamily hydrolase
VTERALQGLVIDWGGVLTASLDGAMSAWATREGITYAHFEEALRAWAGSPAAAGLAPGTGPAEGPVAEVEEADDGGPGSGSPVHQLERGELAAGDFEEILAVELARRGSPVRAPGLVGRMLLGLDALSDDMVGLVRRAHAVGIRTALLSNSWGNRYPAQLWDGMFDVVVISGEVGMRKPEPEIFRHTCFRLGLPPSECVMVDDLPHNVSGAVVVGMVGVLHTSYERTAQELESLFRLPLR